MYAETRRRNSSVANRGYSGDCAWIAVASRDMSEGAAYDVAMKMPLVAFVLDGSCDVAATKAIYSVFTGAQNPYKQKRTAQRH